jgi:hypothetical protein
MFDRLVPTGPVGASVEVLLTSAAYFVPEEVERGEDGMSAAVALFALSHCMRECARRITPLEWPHDAKSLLVGVCGVW